MKKTAPTYWATIFIGFKDVDTGHVHSLMKARKICSDYVNELELCVTLTPTEYIYSEHKGEVGAMIGLINYPRFPMEPGVIEEHAIKLAEILKEKLDQHRVTIQFRDKTIMLGDPRPD